MVDHLIRIGSRLFNLAHIVSIEPGDGDEMDLHTVHGRLVRLRGDDATAARRLVASFPDVPPPGGEGSSMVVADDLGDQAENGGVEAIRS